MEDQDLALALNDIAVGLSKDGKHEAALPIYEAAIRAYPQNALAFYNKGRTLAALGRLTQAMNAYESSIKFGDAVVAAMGLIDKGNILLDQKQYEEALYAFNIAIQLNPREALAYNGQGNALQCLKKYKEALSAFNQAIERDPQSVVAHFNKGNLFYDYGHYREAIQAYDIALRLSPHDTGISRNRALALKKLKR